MKITRILAIRHGETAWNVDTRIQGQIDIPLNDHGRWQAQQLAKALADEDIHAIYASDLSRAFDTAQAVASTKQIAIQARPQLRERHFGDFQGHTWADIQNQYPIDKVPSTKAVRPVSVSYQKQKIKSDFCKVRLIQDKYNRYKFINHIQITQIQP
jgi:probable phosphoglycerate mutase